MSEINHEMEIKKVEKHATCKRVAIDNGHSSTGRYVVFKHDSILLGDAISPPCKKASVAWQSAYNTLKQQGKI